MAFFYSLVIPILMGSFCKMCAFNSLPKPPEHRHQFVCPAVALQDQRFPISDIVVFDVFSTVAQMFMARILQISRQALVHQARPMPDFSKVFKPDLSLAARPTRPCPPRLTCVPQAA